MVNSVKVDQNKATQIQVGIISLIVGVAMLLIGFKTGLNNTGGQFSSFLGLVFSLLGIGSFANMELALATGRILENLSNSFDDNSNNKKPNKINKRKMKKSRKEKIIQNQGNTIHAKNVYYDSSINKKRRR